MRACLMRTGGALLRYEGEVFDRPDQLQGMAGRLLLYRTRRVNIDRSGYRGQQAIWTSNRYFVLAFECAGLESSIKRLFLGAKLV